MKRFLYRWAIRLGKLNYWLIAKVVLAAFALLRRLPADRSLDIADRLARLVGPWSGRHRLAMDNLRKAFPEKSGQELRAIADEMWGHMGRLLAEYIFIDRLSRFDPAKGNSGRIEIEGGDTFYRMRDEKKPRIVFTAHTGNFEMIPAAAFAHGLDAAVLYRAPNNPYLAKELLAMREDSMGRLVASRPGAAFTLARLLSEDESIGLLVDQKFQQGVRTRFFGRECETSPLLAKLAAQFDCDVHPCRCIRLPGNRYRIEIGDEIALPRGADGRIDIDAATQRVNDVVEEWVREYPAQWMWVHKRWRLYGQT